VEEKLIVISNRDGGLENLEVKGKKHKEMKSIFKKNYDNR